jgi:hypothetical protein
MQQQIDLTIETRYLNNFVVHRSYSFIENLYSLSLFTKKEIRYIIDLGFPYEMH